MNVSMIHSKMVSVVIATKRHIERRAPTVVGAPIDIYNYIFNKHVYNQPHKNGLLLLYLYFLMHPIVNIYYLELVLIREHKMSLIEESLF